MSRLKKKGADFGKKTTGDLFLMGFPHQWSDYLESVAFENEAVEAITFPRSAKLTEFDFRNFSNFPNLEAVSIQSKFDSSWLKHLDRCDKLRLFSFISTGAKDDVVDLLIDHDTLEMINASGTNVSLDALRQFRDSKRGRIAYPQQFVDASS